MFIDKQKREFGTAKPALQEMLKNLSKWKTQGEKKRKTYENKPKKWCGNRNIHIDNYLKCKWLNSQTKRQNLVEWIWKQDPYTGCL